MSLSEIISAYIGVIIVLAVSACVLSASTLLYTASESELVKSKIWVVTWRLDQDKIVVRNLGHIYVDVKAAILSNGRYYPVEKTLAPGEHILLRVPSSTTGLKVCAHGTDICTYVSAEQSESMIVKLESTTSAAEPGRVYKPVQQGGTGTTSGGGATAIGLKDVNRKVRPMTLREYYEYVLSSQEDKASSRPSSENVRGEADKYATSSSEEVQSESKNAVKSSQSLSSTQVKTSQQSSTHSTSTSTETAYSTRTPLICFTPSQLYMLLSRAREARSEIEVASIVNRLYGMG